MERAMRSLQDLPPFSPIVTRLMASLAGEDVSFTEIGELIEKDAVLSGNILSLVNSAMYARRSAVTSVRYALSLLGVNKIRNIVLGMQVSGMWNQSKCPQGLSMARFNQHATAVGMLSDFVAQHVPVEYPEGAFVGGLLHDVGRLLLGLGLPKEFAAALAKHQETGASLVECEMQQLQFTHATLSGQVLKIWKLPDPIRVAVARHHNPEMGSEAGSTQIPLSHVISAADKFVNSIGFSTVQGNPTEPDFGAIEALGLAKARAEKLVADFQTEFEATAQFFR